MIAATTSTAVPVAWLVARAAGLTALALLSASLWLGLAMSVRLLAPRRAEEPDGLASDTDVVRSLDGARCTGSRCSSIRSCTSRSRVVLVPGLAPWRPLAVSAGVVAAWLMLALASSFHVRRRITQRRWRLIHYAGFAAFALALGHGLTAGTDLRGLTGLIVAGGLAAPAVWLVYRADPGPAPAAGTATGLTRSGLMRELERASFPAMGTVCALAVTADADPSVRQRGSRSPPRGANCARASAILSRFDPPASSRS